MAINKKKKIISRKRRVLRVRNKIGKGTALQPRLSVFRSNKHIFAQLIDDESAKTVYGIGTTSSIMKQNKLNKKSKKSAQEIGRLVSDFVEKNNITKVIFDRGAYKYHGIVAEIGKLVIKKD